ncbi:MAG: M48 family metallopeptidase [Ruminococcaceae bacterium]|nr:M48 family metallopeptidase [Oscillospiraceae bacterium]
MEYRIVYSTRKTVSIQIKSGEIIVRAPRGLAESEIEKIVYKHSEWIKKALARQTQREAGYEALSESDIKALRKAARAYFNEKCPIFAEKMGLEYKRIGITSARTRFGSCSSKKNINFSFYLMLYPEEAREYVIVHELAHLREMNHSPRFYAIVERYLPDYRARRKLLKSGGVGVD